MNNTDANLFNNLPRWRRYRVGAACNPPPGLACWLFDPGSLTWRLRQCCPDRFQVRVLRQGWSRPYRDEARVLRLRLEARTWTREVQLFCGDQPWVFARTLIPAATLRGRGRRLTQLGNRPLGEVLFSDPGVQRGPVEIARIITGQRLHQCAFAGFAEPPDAIWGRRSIFRIDGQPLLVCEIFLPDSPASPADRIRPYHEY
ncbi:MAG: chorismate lyase [Candidatus Competibacteraceae bacterium]|nr:chorismate lyase [Candidatus Competibacteraceae bacterium]MCP5127923.1 chorismate lyase [Gammaproteobacteria bacterium]HRX71182.1 chorismate lyase [Candidatus Competibacteraceae bacterium]